MSQTTHSFLIKQSRAGALALGLIGLVAAAGAAQAQNAIVTATQAPPPAATPFGYPGPYGNGYPYQTYNPSVQPIVNGQQPTQPGQTQTPAATQSLQSFGGGNSSGGGGGGGGSSSGGGSAGGGSASGGGGAADGASNAVMQDPNSPLYKRYERYDASKAQLRPQILAQIGRGIGIRRGFIDEARRIAASIDAGAAARLDARYDFSKEMIGDHLVPPVIGEVHGVQERGGDRLLYLTVGAYQIVRPARLVLSAPNWRDYLFINTAEPQTAISALHPQNSDEQSIYDQAYQSGLAKGVLEARDTFEDNLNRLERDYSGMQRFHELAHQGAVSLPVVKDARRSVRLADHGQRAFIGEQVVTLRVDPRFKAARPAAFK